VKPRISCPSRGDVVWLDFDPQAGHEQAGRRPALVLSHREYNLKTGMAIVCPMTSRTEKPWPFLVQVGPGSAVIADQVKCVDWRSRRAELKERLPMRVLNEVIEIFSRIILPPEN
jgi:mRNA interferase MazF